MPSQRRPRRRATRREPTRSAATAAEEMTIPAYPRLVADDVTPEALVSLLCEQGGRMAVMSAEGDLFDIMWAGTPVTARSRTSGSS